MVHYGVTKTAQIALARGIAESIAGSGVTANSVLAGPTRSEGAVEFLAKVAAERGLEVSAVEEQFLRTMRPSSLIRRFAEPEEVAIWSSSLPARALPPLPAPRLGSKVGWCGASFRRTLCGPAARGGARWTMKAFSDYEKKNECACR